MFSLFYLFLVENMCLLLVLFKGLLTICLTNQVDWNITGTIISFSFFGFLATLTASLSMFSISLFLFPLSFVLISASLINYIVSAPVKCQFGTFLGALLFDGLYSLFGIVMMSFSLTLNNKIKLSIINVFIYKSTYITLPNQSQWQLVGTASRFGPWIGNETSNVYSALGPPETL